MDCMVCFQKGWMIMSEPIGWVYQSDLQIFQEGRADFIRMYPHPLGGRVPVYGESAQPTAGQSEPVANTRERYIAIREGERNQAEEEYFAARQQSDSGLNRNYFNAGFDRGFDAAIQAAPKPEEIKWVKN